MTDLCCSKTATAMKMLSLCHAPDIIRKSLPPWECGFGPPFLLEIVKMHCYVHRDNEAVGVCKACQKAVCPVCSRDTGNGLACGEVCEKEVADLNQIIEKSKQIYSIGKKSNMPATGILFYAFFGLVFAGFGLYPLSQGRSPDWFPVVMGGGFLLIGSIAYIRTRKLAINC